MKAVVFDAYGPPDVLKVREVPTPVPRDNEVLVRVEATTVNFGDLTARRFGLLKAEEFHMPGILWFFGKLYFGARKPKLHILGNEFAGSVASVGRSVIRFKPGDAVFGYRGSKMGAYAEYLAMPENGVIALRPGNVSAAGAASVVYGGVMAIGLLRKAGVRKGQHVLVNGASGGIGAAAVQLCKHAGAAVTGVCGSSGLEFVRSLGADDVLDYRRDDFTRRGGTYDLIVDILGKAPFDRCRNALKPNGRCLYVSFKTGQIAQMLRTSITGGKKAVCAMTAESPEAIRTIQTLLQNGTMRTFVDREFPLEQAAEAHRYAESVDRKGPVVITIP